jgi:hypothetical protein
MEKALDVLDSIKREIITKRFGIYKKDEEEQGLLQAGGSQESFSGSESPCNGEGGFLHRQKSNSKSAEPNVVPLTPGSGKPSVPSYEELARDITLNGNPKEILRYATKHEKNRLILDEQDIKALEQEALRELARGNRIRYAPKK